MAKEIPLAEMCARYRKLYGGPICDILDRHGLKEQWLHKDIKPILFDMVIAGPAVTYKSECRPHWETDKPAPNITECLYPDCIVVVDPGDEQNSGHVGDITANTWATKGCRGVVVDGGIRDSKNHSRIPNWGAFCRYTSPLEQGFRQVMIDVNKPILLEGSLVVLVQVNPGDFIFGDSDGVIVIPKELAQEVLVEAEKIAERENKAREEMHKGMDGEEVAKKYSVG